MRIARTFHNCQRYQNPLCFFSLCFSLSDAVDDIAHAKQRSRCSRVCAILVLQPTPNIIPNSLRIVCISNDDLVYWLLICECSALAAQMYAAQLSSQQQQNMYVFVFRILCLFSIPFLSIRIPNPSHNNKKQAPL